MQAKTIGELVRTTREEIGFSRETLAKRCGVSRTYIYGIERGDFVPSAALCSLLARHLGLDADETWLLAGHVPSDVLLLLQAAPREACHFVRREFQK